MVVAQTANPSGWEILRRLRGLRQARYARGDTLLFLNPVPQPQEYHDLPDEFEGGGPAGLVLEPMDGAAFEIRQLALRRRRARIGAFCDGTRATYALGFEDVLPLLYTENAA